MKILLDECVTKRLKPHLKEFEVFTVTEMGWGGVKNGKLLTLCVENNFDVLLTIDKNLVYQQNLNKYKISIVVLNTITSKIEEIVEFIPSLKKQLLNLDYHKVYSIDK
jgi:predicted nuclease of predicted toxin-antitoxin system